MTKQGQLKVWHIANGEFVHRVDVDSIEQAKEFINKWTEEDINNPRIEFNAFGVEEFDENFDENDGWSEWYDENGDSIIDIMDRESEE